jgi:hypothetical protein
LHGQQNVKIKDTNFSHWENNHILRHSTTKFPEVSTPKEVQSDNITKEELRRGTDNLKWLLKIMYYNVIRLLQVSSETAVLDIINSDPNSSKLDATTIS